MFVTTVELKELALPVIYCEYYNKGENLFLRFNFYIYHSKNEKHGSKICVGVTGVTLSELTSLYIFQKKGT